ncbi:MAG: hypothetical protein AB7G17_12670 [Phycisphaerales bacterium]
MSASTKATNLLQAYRLVLYKRSLHPELFKVRNRITVVYGAYEFEGWVMPGSHVMRFQHDGHCASELVTEQESGLPERGVAAAFPCAGERDFEHAFGERMKYMSTVQTETLSENLYNATYDELLDFAREVDAAAHLWTDADGGKCLSFLDVQRYRKEIHAQSYHLISAGGLVLRTQSIFEHS